MSVDNKLPSGTRSGKPDKSGNVESNNKPNSLPYFGLARFDTRHITFHNNDNKDSKIEQKRPYDPDGVLRGQPMLECIFCDKYKTAIRFDMELHLYEKHRWELLRQFPLEGKGYSMDFRIEYFIYQIKIRGEKLEQIKNIQTTAQAVATNIKKLIKSTTTINDKLEFPDDRDY